MAAEVRLGDHCSVQSSKRVFAREYVEQGVPFFRSKDVIDKALGSFTGYDLFISEERFRQLKAQTGCPQKGDLLINSVGNRTGQSYIVGDEGDFYFKDGNILWLNRFDGIDPHWLSYWMKSKVGQDALASIMIGSAQKALTIDGLRKLWLRLPSLKEQTEAAALLRCLDEKIELNRRMNETLEEMARALFRDWFVDFSPTRRQMEGATDPAAIMGHAFPPEKAATLASLFPAKLGDDSLPEGWIKQPVRELAEIVGGGTPNTKTEAFWEGGTHLWATPRDLSKLSGVFISNTERKLTDAGLAKVSSGLSPKGSVLMSSRAPIGYLAIASEAVAVNQGFIVMRPTDQFPTHFAKLWCEANMETIEANANGSTFQEISKKNFKPILVTVPSSEVMAAFSRVAGMLFGKVQANEKENQTLAEMRDLLLPKLMSGEIRLKELETAI
ncbi:restriction endonuclease subunit S [Epibacterium ulvae]|uniref:restriction endonuclease subunit S n=1 Tax=Epibacterium ulvae TaxID=1156985 RepID=UPI00248FF3BC|nr:restriction endonuclease subunit S [Epibacterium ulvae]